MRGLRPLLAEGDIAIVDAAVIDLAELSIFDSENGSFRGHGNMSHPHQILPGINQRRGVDRIIHSVLAHYCWRIARIGKDPPDADGGPSGIGGDEFAAQARDFGDIAIGDGAVAGGKDEDDDAGAGAGEGGDGSPVKTDAELIFETEAICAEGQKSSHRKRAMRKES